MDAAMLGMKRDVWQPCVPSCSGSGPAAVPLPHELGRSHITAHAAQPLPHRRRQSVRVLAGQSSETKVKPAYNKYRSRADIERDYVRQWKEITALDGRLLPPMTLRSLLWFVVVWTKYEVVPEPLRYVWWLLWSRACAAAHAVHRRAVLQGAKLDVWLAKRRGYGDVHMSRALVMRRYHGSVSWLDTIVYRIRLLQGQEVRAMLAEPAPQSA